MKFSVGYPVIPNEEFSETVVRYSNKINEVYFSWKGTASGRMPMSEQMQSSLENDLDLFRKQGLKLCLLINGNCYGANAISEDFAKQIKHDLNEIAERYDAIDSITTTSPFVAFIIKQSFPSIEVRASVNMRIGTVEAMTYMKENFDGFYVQREFNRNF